MTTPLEAMSGPVLHPNPRQPAPVPQLPRETPQPENVLMDELDLATFEPSLRRVHASLGLRGGAP